MRRMPTEAEFTRMTDREARADLWGRIADTAREMDRAPLGVLWLRCAVFLVAAVAVLVLTTPIRPRAATKEKGEQQP